jgi:diguanylate cyclase (GGDEF)-like protein
VRKFLYLLRYYTLDRDDYIRCVEEEVMNNLRLTGITGILFSIFATYAAINFIISQAVENYFIPSTIFFGLAIISALCAAVSFRSFAKYKRGGKRAGLKLVHTAMAIGYIIIVLSTIYTEIWVAPWGIPVVFTAFIGAGILLLPPYPLMSSLLALAMLSVYFVSSFIVITPECCWVCELSDAAFGVLISIALMWYVNMHKMVATHATFLMRKERDKYLTESTIDELTKIANRRAFMQRFERYLKNGRPRDNFLCCAIIDIDYFKDYNDHYGHVAGDECLRKIGEALNQPLEASSAYAARVGGEEFAVIWFAEQKSESKNIVLQLLNRIKDLKIPHEKSKADDHVTVSIGAYIAPCGVYDNQDTIYNMADKMLYEAKKGGRNRAVVLNEDGDKYTLTL